MRKAHVVTAVAIVLVAVLLLGAYEQTPKWEYARFRYLYGAPSRAVRWSWTSPGVYAEGANVKELGTKLSIKLPPKGAGAFSIVDWAGSNGWELVTVEAMEAEYTIAAWFKRPG
ncbi:MAG: hypothetical protein ACYSWO_22750 [Planctomycetota bacterium]|jgi:hypothetical protein